MPGPMSGPVPKRSEERRRNNKDAVEIQKVDIDSLIRQEVEVPLAPTKVDEGTGEVSPRWHPAAQHWFESLKKSGQAIFYEPSDWSLAYLIAEAIDRELQPQPVVLTGADGEQSIEWHRQPMKGATLNAILKANELLMAAEGARRRLRIELDRKAAADRAIEGEGASVVSIVKNREELLA